MNELEPDRPKGWCGFRHVLASFFFSMFGWIYGHPPMVFQKKVFEGMLVVLTDLTLVTTTLSYSLASIGVLA